MRIRLYSANRDDFEARRTFISEYRYGVRNYSFLIWIVYSFLMEASRLQGTLGKFLLGIKVVNADGGRLTPSQAWKRNLGKMTSLAIFGIGFLMVAFNGRKQGLHDRMAKTYVIDNREKGAGRLTS